MTETRPRLIYMNVVDDYGPNKRFKERNGDRIGVCADCVSRLVMEHLAGSEDQEEPIQPIVDEDGTPKIRDRFKDGEIYRCIRRLSRKEATVIIGRFRKRKTLEQVAKGMGFTREYIRQVEDRAMRKISVLLKPEDEV